VVVAVEASVAVAVDALVAAAVVAVDRAVAPAAVAAHAGNRAGSFRTD
jgi:hypothetical protein